MGRRYVVYGRDRITYKGYWWSCRFVFLCWVVAGIDDKAAYGAYWPAHPMLYWYFGRTIWRERERDRVCFLEEKKKERGAKMRIHSVWQPAKYIYFLIIFSNWTYIHLTLLCNIYYISFLNKNIFALYHLYILI